MLHSLYWSSSTSNLEYLVWCYSRCALERHCRVGPSDWVWHAELWCSERRCVQLPCLDMTRFYAQPTRGEVLRRQAWARIMLLYDRSIDYYMPGTLHDRLTWSCELPSILSQAPFRFWSDWKLETLAGSIRAVRCMSDIRMGSVLDFRHDQSIYT
jgi:hypothetical protein